MSPEMQVRVVGAEHRLRQLISDMNDIWASSLHESEPGTAIDLYAVDADIAYMYMSPVALHRYGALLRHEALAKTQRDEELKVLESKLVEFLASLIFFGMRPACAPLIIGDHANEFHNMVARVADEAVRLQQEWRFVLGELAEWQKRTTAQSHQTLSDAIAMLTPDSMERGVDDRVAEVFAQIQQSLCGDGALGQLFRLDMLTSADRLRHIDRLELQTESGAATCLPSPYTEDGKLTPRVGRLAARLLRKMNLLDQVANREPARQSDAHVLAHIAWLNEQLALTPYYLPATPVPRRVLRVLLISGSQLLGRAIHAAQLTELDECVFSPLSMLGHRSMGDYVPALATDPYRSVGSAPVIRTSALINFLDAMRQTLSRAMETDSAEAIEAAFVDVQNRHTKLVASWQGRQLLDEHSQPSPVAAAIRALEESGASVNQLLAFVQRTTAYSWQAFARAIALLALSPDHSTDHVESSLPPLELDGYPVAQALLTQLLHFPYGAEGAAGAASPMNEAMLAQLAEEDPSHFTEFLCYGLWTLGHTLLGSAQGCAELALSIVDDDSQRPYRAQERAQALYLRANLIKRRARSVDALDRAEQCVTFDAGELARPCELLMHGERFSIRCHRYYFETLGTDQRPVPRRHDQGRAETLYREGASLLAMLRHAGDGASAYSQAYLRHQVLVNMVQLALLRKFGFTTSDQMPNSVFTSMDPDPGLLPLERDFEQVTAELIELQHCVARTRDGSLPKPSAMSSALVIVAGLVWMPSRRAAYDRSAFEGRRQSVFEARRMAFLERIAAYKQPELQVNSFKTVLH